MKKVTLTVVAVLLAVPALAHAKVGIEFNNSIEQTKPGDSQTFSAIVMKEPSDPAGGGPRAMAGVHVLVTFHNTRTGRDIRVRTATTNADGVGTGSVVFPDKGPWAGTLSVGGHNIGGNELGTFEIGHPVHPVTISTPPADAATAPAKSGTGGLPAWLLSFPAAALVALGILWRIRRRPRELGA